MPDKLIPGEKKTPVYKKSGFKMKGSPMQRNFGVGSPLHDEQALLSTGPLVGTKDKKSTTGIDVKKSTGTMKNQGGDPYTQHNVSGGNQQARINAAKALNMNLKVYNAKPGDKVKLKGTDKRMLKSHYTFPTLKKNNQ